eukprot:9457-Eustigmatos_ZCMA.PRE.1
MVGVTRPASRTLYSFRVPTRGRPAGCQAGKVHGMGVKRRDSGCGGGPEWHDDRAAKGQVGRHDRDPRRRVPTLAATGDTARGPS